MPWETRECIANASRERIQTQNYPRPYSPRYDHGVFLSEILYLWLVVNNIALQCEWNPVERISWWEKLFSRSLQTSTLHHRLVSKSHGKFRFHKHGKLGLSTRTLILWDVREFKCQSRAKISTRRVTRILTELARFWLNSTCNCFTLKPEIRFD